MAETKALFTIEQEPGCWLVACRFCEWTGRSKTRTLARKYGQSHHAANHKDRYPASERERD